jgi:hypothetical protein
MDIEYYHAQSQTIIWLLFSGYIHYPVLVVAIEVSDVHADVGGQLEGVLTLLKQIHVSLA